MMRKKGFTLTELLVVIAIISMLMAILLGPLNKARRQAETVLCLNNLKQMCITAAIYTQIYDGYYPIAYYSEETQSAEIEYCWDFTVVNESGNISIVPGLLWRSEMIEKIQQCPSFKGNSNTQYDPYTGYNYNTSYIGHGQWESIPTPAKVNQVGRPGDCALFGDGGQFGGGANKFMRAPLRSPADRTFSARFAGTQGYRHNGKTNVAWCDGHACSQKQLYTNIMPARHKAVIEEYNKTAKSKIGFLSPDNNAYDLE